MSTTYAMKWTANAIQTVPNLSDLVSSGYPTNGDPSKGIAPTLPGAAWFHWVSQTLGCAIQGNGLTIDQTKTDQLLSAMKNLGKTVVPIGTVVFYLGTTIPDGYLLCNGASLLRTEYPELFEVLGTKCGSVDSAHFNLPNLHHRFIEGTTTLSEVGSYVEAGLPNISGEWSYTWANSKNASVSGAAYFRNPDSTSSFQVSPNNPGSGQLGFDASHVSNLYQNNLNEVRVNAIFGMCLIRSHEV